MQFFIFSIIQFFNRILYSIIKAYHDESVCVYKNLKQKSPTDVTVIVQTSMYSIHHQTKPHSNVVACIFCMFCSVFFLFFRSACVYFSLCLSLFFCFLCCVPSLECGAQCTRKNILKFIEIIKHQVNKQILTLIYT